MDMTLDFTSLVLPDLVIRNWTGLASNTSFDLAQVTQKQS